MKQSNVKANAHAFKGAAALITTAVLAMLFTGCPNSAGGSGSGGGGTPTPPSQDKTYTVLGIRFTMKGIAAVTNGSVGHDDSSSNEPHTVSLSAYLIGETEVTQLLWQVVMHNNRSLFKGSSYPPESGEEQWFRPVERVDWYECIAFCNELTKKVYGTDTECIYTANGHAYGIADARAEVVPVMDMSKKGFRLPTEAEWEWAAMGGTSDKWSGTNTESELRSYAWYYANSGSKTHEVKKKKPNGYGLYDMSGNVWEWCWDWFTNSTPAGGQDPTGASSGSDRVRRGGDWIDTSGGVACAFRKSDRPNDRDNSGLGLRVVCRP